MSPKLTLLDAGHADDLYLAGKTQEEIAAFFGVTAHTVKRFLVAKGVVLRTKQQALIAGGQRRRCLLPLEVVNAYREGESVDALARRLGVTEKVVHRFLLENGVDIRDRSEATRTRISKLTYQERLKLSEAARSKAISSGVMWTKEALERARCNRAQTAYQRKCLATSSDNIFAGMLHNRGLEFDTQVPVRGYNLDLARAPVAVEIHLSANNPSSIRRLRQRSKDLLDWGWHVLYVWVTRQFFLTEGAVDQVVAFLEELERDQPTQRQYRVIRGSGELVTAVYPNLD